MIYNYFNSLHFKIGLKSLLKIIQQFFTKNKLKNKLLKKINVLFLYSFCVLLVKNLKLNQSIFFSLCAIPRFCLQFPICLL